MTGVSVSKTTKAGRARAAWEMPRWLERRTIEPALVVVTLAALVLSFVVEAAGQQHGDSALTLLGSIAYLAGGFFGFVESLKSLRARELNIDVLMIAAAIGAALVGEWQDGAILLFLFSLSNVLQDYAIGRSRKAIRSLFALYPEEARVRTADGVKTVPISEIQVGQMVLIQPGERIPVDGDVTGGQTSVDQATITGESMPVDKGPGDRVFAGTLNKNGAIDVRATAVASHSTLARIITMVEEAQARKAPTQRFLEEFEQYYALIVIGTSLAVLLVTWLLLGWSFHDGFYRAMVLLVVASPCALVISVPASFLSAIAAGARRGVIFKGGAHLEQMGTVKVVAFDKTGTLTRGRPAVTDVVAYNGHSEEALLRAAASVEARSEHPLAAAIRAAAEERGLALDEVGEFYAEPGQGVAGFIGETLVRVGRAQYITECAGQPPVGLLAEHDRLRDQGKTVLLACYGGEWMGALAVADQLRPQSAQMVADLHRAGVQRVVMLTGDNAVVARQIAEQVGVDDVRAELMPDDKATIMTDLERAYGPVAMVGDGVNDAPALATATVGIAMGAAGTDVALETADVVLMGDALEAIPYTIRLSRKARRVVWQNIFFSLSVIVVLVIGTFAISLPLPLGVVGHEGSTVIVVLNGLRLLIGRVGD
ncbi:MAG: heavy metal translocating P-type ATPase [Anaerolineae bacterium]|nr:heavy metal translocating P-type ATPase [Anaerolineae bacterium]